MHFLTAIIAACSMAGAPVCEHCDAFEVNHVFNVHERIGPAPTYNLSFELEYRFSAVIFWELDADAGWKVRDWRWAVHTGAPGPTADGRWCLEWEEEGRIRHVTADALLVTWTTYDVEVAVRPLGRRPGLARR